MNIKPPYAVSYAVSIILVFLGMAFFSRLFGLLYILAGVGVALFIGTTTYCIADAIKIAKIRLIFLAVTFVLASIFLVLMINGYHSAIAYADALKEQNTSSGFESIGFSLGLITVYIVAYLTLLLDIVVLSGVVGAIILSFIVWQIKKIKKNMNK